MKRKTYSNELYFVTLTVVDWVDVFIRRLYSDFIIDNLKYCQDKKNLDIFAYVIMTNHIHMIARSTKNPLSDVLRDFKTFTSKEIYKLIKDQQQESRKNWMLPIFDRHGRENPVNKGHQFWQNGNHPIVLYSNSVIDQKVNYIHENPVKAGFVSEAHEYYYSSAHPESPLKVMPL